jgi:hypothetical protein
MGYVKLLSSGLSIMTAYIMQMFLSNHKSKLCGGENVKTVAARNPPLPFYNKTPRQIWDMSSCCLVVCL